MELEKDNLEDVEVITNVPTSSESSRLLKGSPEYFSVEIPNFIRIECGSSVFNADELGNLALSHLSFIEANFLKKQTKQANGIT